MLPADDTETVIEAGILSGALAGIVLGAAGVYFLLKSRIEQSREMGRTEIRGESKVLEERLAGREKQIEELRGQTARLGEEIQAARALCSAEQERRAAAEERIGRIAELERDLAGRDERLASAQAEITKCRARIAELETKLAAAAASLQEERQRIETQQKKLQADFEALSNKALLDNASRFNLQSAESLGKVLAPIKETLTSFKDSLDKTRAETAAHSTLLKDQIGRIGAEAANLSRALKGDAKALGNWGENMLDQILEKSGLQQGLHYRRQRGAKGEDGDQRFLDVIVDLPDHRQLVIDSKVSLRAYEESVNAADEGVRMERLAAHIESVRRHFKDLGARRYQDIHGINAPDFVLMYVPIEAAFFAAVASEPGLFAEAFEHDVVITTNSTLLATLRTVSHVWRLADQQKNALEIAERGGRLYDKFVGFIQDLQEVGRAVDKARSAWESASSKLHMGRGNLVNQAEDLKALGAKASKSLPAEIVERAAEGAPALPTSLAAGGIEPPTYGL